MSRVVSKVEQAFYTRKTKDSMLLLFWSSDWYTLRPWTYRGEPIRYIDKRLEYRKQGMMISRAIGPLMIVYYKKDLHYK